MSLSATTFSGSVSHFSRDSAFQVMCAFLSASEYLKDETEPDALPYTPRSRGPSLSLSSAWQPPQRLSKTSFPRAESSALRARVTTKKMAATLVMQYFMSLPSERRINHRKTMFARDVLDIRNADHAAQALRR